MCRYTYMALDSPWKILDAASNYIGHYSGPYFTAVHELATDPDHNWPFISFKRWGREEHVEAIYAMVPPAMYAAILAAYNMLKSKIYPIEGEHHRSDTDLAYIKAGLICDFIKGLVSPRKREEWAIITAYAGTVLDGDVFPYDHEFGL